MALKTIRERIPATEHALGLGRVDDEADALLPQLRAGLGAAANVIVGQREGLPRHGATHVRGAHGHVVPRHLRLEFVAPVAAQPSPPSPAPAASSPKSAAASRLEPAPRS